MDGIWPAAEIRAAEQRVMERCREGALMSQAAHAVAVEACRMLGFRYGARVALLVGSGDNGGDALFAGAELARRGVGVRAVLSMPDRVHPAGLAAFSEAGGRVSGLDVPHGPGEVDLIIDGLLGIGASGPLRELLVPSVEYANASAAGVLAVDIPSGVDPDTGAVMGTAIRADLTVCMGALKPGLVTGDGRRYAGLVRVIDIGLGPDLPEAMIQRLTDADLATLLRQPRAGDDKYTRGVVGVAAGSGTYPGAAQLSVGAARLGGVGAVRYAGHVAAEVAQRWPEVLVSDTVSETGRVQCWVVGPGLGDSAVAIRSLEAVLATDVPVVVDADGLNLLVDRRDLLSGRRAPTVLTPHDREFARLFGDVGPDRIGAARRAAEECGAVVLLKGFATVVAEPGGRCFINPTGTPSLATAGSGDVLSGLIGSLIAAGLEPSLGAAVGAYLHGRAAESASDAGPVSAMDLLPALRRVLAVIMIGGGRSGGSHSGFAGSPSSSI